MPVPARPAALLVPLAAVALLAGCSIAVGTPGSGSPAPSDPSRSAPPPTLDVPTPSVPTVDVPDDGTATDGATTDGPSSGGRLAAGFPLPAGARVDLAADDTSGETAGTITVPSADDAYDFFRKQLPRHGYTVTSAEQVSGLGEIRFSGHGCGGDSQLAFTGSTTVRYQCDAG